jgi:nitrogenase molybdenum-iron protein alpha/beta subunit
MTACSNKKSSFPSGRRPSAPGKITQRSCAYAGARWMLAPLKDAIHVVHGPVGCAYNGVIVRGTAYRIFSTDLREKDIIFGGRERLARTLKEAKILVPDAKYIFVYNTCSSAIIGDDMEAICKKMEKELDCPIVLVDCPGFKGQSEAAGHRIAYECILNRFIGQRQRYIGPYDVNIIGQYNVNETKIIKSLVSKMGINVHCVFTGDASYERIITAHYVKLNLIICQNTGQFFAETMQERYGVPYLKVSFLSLSQSIDSLRRIGKYFGLEKEAETVIDEEYKAIKPQLTQFLPGLKGKKAAVFLGAARIADLVKTFETLSMEVVFVGSRFGNAINYRDIRQMAKVDIHIIDDPSEQNLEDLFCKLRPDVFITGIKEQSLCHKFGIGSLLPQLGAYVGFKGFLNFVRDVHKAIYAPVWRLAREKIS